MVKVSVEKVRGVCECGIMNHKAITANAIIATTAAPRATHDLVVQFTGAGAVFSFLASVVT